MAFYTGKFVPEWRNNLFVASHMGEHVARLALKGDKVVGEVRLLLGSNLLRCEWPASCLFGNRIVRVKRLSGRLQKA